MAQTQSGKHSTKKHGHTSSYHLCAPISKIPDSSRVGGSGSRSSRRLKSSSKRKRERHNSGVPDENIDCYGLPASKQENPPAHRGLYQGINSAASKGVLHDTPNTLLKKSSSSHLRPLSQRQEGSQSLLKARLNQFVNGSNLLGQQPHLTHKQSSSSGLLPNPSRLLTKPSTSKKTAEKSTASRDKLTPRQPSSKAGHTAYRRLDF